MEGEGREFEAIGSIYAQYTEENKESLVKTARNLLKVQNADKAVIASVPSPDEAGKQGLA